ncbi:MAG TPA: rod shape-determining protein MreC [Burkholderiales bacterium]|nr:rod shape-determining protein MreC [Burkholderiales bacterium]
MDTQLPPLFKRGPSPLTRLVFFTLLSLLLFVTDARFKYLETFRLSLSVVIYPLQKLATAPGLILSRVSDFFATHTYLTDENARLKQQNLLNAAQLQRYQALEQENNELRQLLKARDSFQGNVALAEILYSGRDLFSRRIVIDKGREDSIRPGQAVVDSIGVIGQVTRAYPLVSEVTLITDKDQTVPVQVVRNGLRAVVFGAGEAGGLELRYMPVNVDLQTGDQLVTSGIDGTYPYGLPVAVVSKIERDAAYAFARIFCTPSAGVNQHRQVLVLTSPTRAPENLIADPSSKTEAKTKKARRGN